MLLLLPLPPLVLLPLAWKILTRRSGNLNVNGNNDKGNFEKVSMGISLIFWARQSVGVPKEGEKSKRTAGDETNFFFFSCFFFFVKGKKNDVGSSLNGKFITAGRREKFYQSNFHLQFCSFPPNCRRGSERLAEKAGRERKGQEAPRPIRWNSQAGSPLHSNEVFN